MSFFRRAGPSTDQTPKDTKAEERDFSTYGQVRDAVASEKEVMKLLVELGEEEFNKLMEASQAYIESQREAQRHEKEMAAMKERTARSEHMKFAEEEHTKRQKIKQESKLRQMHQKAEELKKLEEKKTEELRKQINYEQEKITAEEQKRELIRLEAKREFEKLDSDRAKEQEEREMRQFKRDLELAKMKIAEKAEMAKQNEIELGEFRLEQQLKQHNATKDDLLHRDMELRKIDKATTLEKTGMIIDGFQEFFSGDEGRRRMYNLGGLIIGSGFCLYAFKSVSPIVTQGLSHYFFKPTLVSRAVTIPRNPVVRAAKKIKEFASPPEPIPDPIFEPNFQKKMEGLLDSIRTTAAKKKYYGNMMLYGKPGTGKTLLAEKIARESGMNFAQMSGPSFDQFEPAESVQEIKKLFKWVNGPKNTNGVLLFVDEADSFLEDRSSLEPGRVRVLNEWLNQTGTESRKFMCVYETNRPEVLDPAVQSRITRSYEMPLPSTPEIIRLLEQFLELRVIKPMEEANRRKRIANWFTSWFKRKESEKEMDSKEMQTTEGEKEQQEGEKSEEQKREEEGMKLVGVNDHGYHKDVARFKLDLLSIARKLAAEGFVGRDVSNLCIAISHALDADPKKSESLVLTQELVNEVVNEQIEKKRKDIQFFSARQARLKSLHKFDSTQHV